MFTLLLQLWFTTPAKVRYLVAAVPFVVGIVIFFVTFEWLALVGGAVLTGAIALFSVPSDSEKKGYHF